MVAIKETVSPQGNLASVTGTTRWRWAFVAVFVLFQGVKLWLAVRLTPFADEAFYWQESRRLAWGYSDLPGLTAWLIRLGQALAGSGTLAMRWPFLLLGATLPWLVIAWTRRHFGARCGWQAGLLVLGMPLAGTLGVLALPDVPLTVAAMLALLALDRVVLPSPRGRDWWLLGCALAIAVASHYRAGMLLLAGLLFVTATARGRSVWRNTGWYMALGLGVVGALPMLAYNVGHEWAGLAFQMVERNPWHFHADALRQPLEQALVVSPPLYIVLLWMLCLALRRRCDGAPWDLAACVGVVVLAGYFLAGLFADGLRFRLHWPLPGYLPLLALVPAWLARRRAWAWMVAVTVGVMQLAAVAALCVATRAGDGSGLSRVFAGWSEAAAVARRELAQAPGDVLVADNFKLAAELDFALHGSRPVYVLDSPANVKHGRARQIAEWHRDGEALAAKQAGARVLLAVDETSLREGARPGWLGTICDGMADLAPVARIDLQRAGRRIAFYRGTVRADRVVDPRGRDACVVWREAYAAQYPAR